MVFQRWRGSATKWAKNILPQDTSETFICVTEITVFMSSSEGLAIKSTVARRPQIHFFLCFPSLRPLVKSFYILGCNEASFGLCLSGLNPLSFDPATNNDPLQFNGSSGPLVTECPVLETSTENTKKRKRASLPPGTDSKLTAVTLPHGAFSLVWYKRWP